jgi:hypothetical protein
MWITAAILLGAASGHPFTPAVAAAGHLEAFVVAAAARALAPEQWRITSLRAKQRALSTHATDA